jgi:hypothetical protein
MAEGVDPVELLHGLAEDATGLLGVASTGIPLADAHRVLHFVAASSEATRALETYQLQRNQGPCLDSYHSGAPISVADLRAEAARWPQGAFDQTASRQMSAFGRWPAKVDVLSTPMPPLQTTSESESPISGRQCGVAIRDSDLTARRSSIAM